MIKYKSSRLIHVFLKMFDISLLPKEHHQNYWNFLQVNKYIIDLKLKTDTTLLQYIFYQFQYFIITWLVYQHSISSHAFLFLTRLRFPAQDSIIKILRRHYGDGLVKKVQRNLIWEQNLRSLILNTEKLYWIWRFYSHARNKNSFRSSYCLK